MLLTCTGCGGDNAVGSRFCADCGSKLLLVCAGCGAAAAGRFCNQCGAPLQARGSESPLLPQADAPVSERRVATLLFGDLVGFTPLSEARDPEAVRELLSMYFERARAVIDRYGGTVEKFIGDAVCAVFGVPVAREDDAERAVRAGLDLVSAVTALGEEQRVEGLALRAGVTTGPVAVTLGAVGQGMVAGDSVNTAARIQAAAGADEVWVDDATRALTTAALAYEPVGARALKGKAVPVELFRAVRTVAAAGGSQRVDGLEAPFLGRDRELRLVKELFHATAEERRPRLVLVTGDPGLGKSRLSWEFEKYLDAITSSSTYWLRGRCPSYGQGVAGRVVAEMLRSLLRVTEEDDREALLAALEERLARHVPDPGEREVLRPRLLSLLGLSEEVFPQGDLFACWRAFLESLTTDGTSVTLVVEDLQWADDGLLDFLEHLLDAGRSPLMVLALARPEVGARRPELLTGRRSTTVSLDPLPDPVVRRLLDGLVRDLPDALRHELVARAEGVPLYAVETVRSLIDRDVVVPREGHYAVDPAALPGLELAALAPPPTLQALLAARLDSLSPPERRVVQDASVLGLSFTRTGLVALGIPEDGLDAVLEQLRRKEILVVDDDPRSPERGQLRFVQALLRQVAYDTLARRDRKARHLAVADHVQMLTDPAALAGIAAQHLLDAAAAVPDDSDVDALHARAVALLETAAEHALTVGAPLDAISHYRRLLDLDPPDDVCARVCATSADLALRKTRFAECGAALSRGLEAVERGRLHGSPPALRLRLYSAEHRLWLGDHHRDVRDTVREVFDLARPDPSLLDVALEASRTFVLAHQYRHEDPQAMQEVALATLAAVERHGDEAHWTIARDVFLLWANYLGYRRLGRVLHRDAVATLDLRHPLAPSEFCNIAAYVVFDDVAAARRAVELAGESIALTGGGNNTHLAVTQLVLTLTGEWDEADQRHASRQGRSELVDWEAYYDGVVGLRDFWRDLPVVPPSSFHADGFHEAAWAAVGEGLRTLAADGGHAAVTAMQHALEPFRGLDRVHEDLPFALLLLVDLLVETGDHDGMRWVLDLLAPLPPGQRVTCVRAQVARVAAHLSDDAVPGLRTAVGLFAEQGSPFLTEAVRLELAAALERGGDSVGAAQAREQAEPLLRQLRAARVLRRTAVLNV